MGKSKKLWKARILTVLVSPIVFFLLCELIYRTTAFSPLIGRHPCLPTWNHPQYLFMPDEKAGYSLRPFFQGTQINPFGNFRTPVTVNSLGFRDRGLQGSICKNCSRIMLLGDSYVFGEGVDWEHTYSARLENILRDEWELKVQVINGGVPGYSLTQTFERLKKYRQIVKPDLVVVGWDPFTFTREEEPMTYVNGYLVFHQHQKQIRVVGANLFRTGFPPESRLGKADVWMQSHSLVYFFVKHRLRKTLYHYVTKKIVADRDIIKMQPIHLKKPMDIILRINDYCQEDGSRLILVLLVSEPSIAEVVERLCREKNITMISLAERSPGKEAPNKTLLFKHDAHFNEKGHAYMAEKLAPAIIYKLDQGAGSGLD